LDTVTLPLTVWIFHSVIITLGGKHFSDNEEEKQSVEKWQKEFSTLRETKVGTMPTKIHRFERWLCTKITLCL